MKETEIIKPESLKTHFVETLKNRLRFDELNWLNNLPLVLLVAILGLFHVSNTHLAESKIRKINNMEQEIKELRWLYMTSKSDLMYKSKQSEVAKMVKDQGLKELVSPPFKIAISKTDYE